MSDTPTSGKPKTKVAEKSAKTTQPKQKSALSGLALFLAVVSIILVLALGYAGFTHLQKQQTQREAVQTQAREITTLQNTLSQQAAEIQTLKTTKAALEQQPQTPTHQWVLAEVTHLVQMANDNLQFTGNINAAIAQLKAAQARLQQQQATDLLPARQAIANDIAQLSGLPQINLQQILIELNALEKTVASMPIIPSKLVPATVTTATPPTDERWWQKGGVALTRFLKEAVVVRTQQTSTPALLSPEAHANLVANIQLQLAQAKWAAIARKGQIYQDSLKQAHAWIVQYFPKSRKTDFLLTSLTQLSEQDIAPTLPNLDNTLAALQDINKPKPPGNKETKPKSEGLDKLNQAAVL